MSAKALHPVRVAGGVVKPGGDIDPEKISETRLARLARKGRVALDTESAPVNRAEQASGRDLPPAPVGLKT